MRDWEPTGAPPVLDELVLDDLDTLADVTHAVRGPIFRRLKSPRSAAELAAEMNVPVTRLYHHLNVLESRQLIRVVATRKVGAATERRYQVVARSLRFDEEHLGDLDAREVAQVMGSLFDVAKVGLQREIEAGNVLRPGHEGRQAIMTLSEFRLDAERQAELVARLTALFDEYAAADAAADDDDPSAEPYTLFVAAHPVRTD